MSRHSYIIVCMLSMTVAISNIGCCRHLATISVGGFNQPLACCESGRTATAAITNNVCGLAIHTSLVWQDSRGNKYDASRIIARCEKYLRSIGYIREREIISIEPTRRLMPFLDDASRDRQSVTGYADTHVIVCLNPVIVVIIPEPVPHYNTIMYGQENVEGTGEAVFYLLHDGYAFGHRFTYFSDVEWYSPDLSVPPTDCDVVNEDRLLANADEIEAVITKDRDEWIFTCLRRRVGKGGITGQVR